MLIQKLRMSTEFAGAFKWKKIIVTIINGNKKDGIFVDTDFGIDAFNDKGRIDTLVSDNDWDNDLTFNMIGGGAGVNESNEDNTIRFTDEGTSHDNMVFGNGGNGKVFSGIGKDKLFGGAGKDILKGGAGDGPDVIEDFKNGVDMLDLADFGFTNKTEALSHFFERGSATDDVVGFEFAGTTIKIKGLDLAD